MYFRLYPECYFVKGLSKGAIFDLINSKTYGLSKDETELIEKCENNEKIDENIELLEKLQTLCLGNFYKEVPYIQKLRFGSPFTKNELGLPPMLYRVFLELNNICNLNCDFCGINGVKRTSGCMGCNIWNEDSEPLKIDRWKEIVREVVDLDCQEIFIKGGDITLNWERTMEIVNMAYGNIPDIYVIINNKSLKANIIQDLENKAELIVQIDNPEKIHPHFINIVTLGEGEWNNIQNNSEKLILDYTMVTEKTCKDLPFMNRTNVSPPNMLNFLENTEFHPCLSHSLTICFDGKVLPCPMMRDYKLGDVRESSFATIFSKMDEINEFWELNLGKIEKCKNCEFKYVCEDCRALEENLTGNLKGKFLCNYNPSNTKD